MDLKYKHRRFSLSLVFFAGLLVAYEVYVFGCFLTGSRTHLSLVPHLCRSQQFMEYCDGDWQVQLERSTQTPDQPERYVFIFGDSFSSIEYNFTAVKQPTVDNPFGNSEFSPDSAYKDEKWIDTLFAKYPSRTTVVYDFATGGNLVNVSRMPEPFVFSVNPRKDMIDQVTQFRQLKPSKVGWNATNSMFISWFGINDIDAIAVLADIEVEEAMEILTADVGDYWDQIAHVYDKGARNFIHVIPPPFDRAPVWTAAGRQRVHEMVAHWTKDMLAGHEAFHKHHPDVQSAIVDPAPIFHQVLDNPRNYGAPNATCWSMLEEDHCLWRDSLHPGLQIHQGLGESIYQLSQSLGMP